MKDLETCVDKKEMGELLISFTDTVNGKAHILEHLRTNPLYRCYFCDGLNEDCNEFVSLRNYEHINRN